MERLRRSAVCIFDQCELAHFRTSKTVQIHDWRLGLIYWLLVILALVYSGVSIPEGSHHLVSVVPVGSTSHWVGANVPSDLQFYSDGRCVGPCGQSTSYSDALNKMKHWTDAKNGSFAYCNDPAYNFRFSADWEYGPYQCSFLHESQAYQKQIDNVYFATAVQETTRKCFVAAADVENRSTCGAAAVAAGLPCANSSYLAGTCCCSSTGFVFNAAVEHLAVEFDHSFASMYDSDVASGKGERPRTIFRDSICASKIQTTDLSSCDLFEVPAGEIISVSIQKLLSLLKIDLDGDACEQPGGSESLRVNSVCPKTRMLGVQIEFKMSYYNFNLHSSTNWFHDGPPLCIVEIAPKVTWNSLGSDVRLEKEPSWAKGALGLQQAFETHDQYRYGISVRFAHGYGKIGKLDVHSLVGALLQGVVLLGLATRATTFLARFMMGTASTVFDGAINERLSYKREMARFMIQSLVGHKVMEGIDLDGDGTISEEELAVATRKLLSKWMTQGQIDECRKALFDLFDTQTRPGSKVEPEGERTLDITELIDCLTDDRITIDILRNVMLTATITGEMCSDDMEDTSPGVMARAIMRRPSVAKIFAAPSQAPSQLPV